MGDEDNWQANAADVAKISDEPAVLFKVSTQFTKTRNRYFHFINNFYPRLFS